MSYEDVIGVLTILLLTSASVERFLEFLNKSFQSFGLFAEQTTTQSKEAPKPPPSQAAPDATAENEMNSAEGDPSSLVILAQGAIKDRQMIIKKFVLQIGGCILGIILCFNGDLGVFKMLNAPIGESLFSTWMDYVLTGILIGTGTEPIHALIRFLQAKHESAQAEAEAPPPVPVAPEAPAPTPDKLLTAKPVIDIQYYGGLEPLKNANRLRQANPDMIIYHHTEMHSDATFEDLVTVFRERGFVTGYHSVITADGNLHNYCRWDARGIHAKDYNERALALAFCGCFDAEINTPQSNDRGIMGNLLPTQAQLLTGAKVIALWSLLYGIDIQQQGKLVPHHAIAPDDSPTTCPGKNFPYARFQALVGQIFNEWQSSERVISEIDDFKKKEFLFV